jgi:ethanolamine utilization protein EutM
MTLSDPTFGDCGKPPSLLASAALEAIPRRVPRAPPFGPWRTSSAVPRLAMGFVESRGLIGAIEAADAMCKTAHVTLVRCERIDGALVTVVVRGDVGSVEAAVEAGARAAARVGEVVARHVIPAPDGQIDSTYPWEGGRAERGRPPA